MTAGERGPIAHYSRVLRKALSSKRIVGFLTRQTLMRSAAARRRLHLYTRVGDPADVPHDRIDPGHPVVASTPIDAAMEAHLRAYGEDIGACLPGGALVLSFDLRAYAVRDCDILPWLGVVLHRPTEMVIVGRPDAQPQIARKVRDIPGTAISLVGEPRGHNHYFHFFETLAATLRVLRWQGAAEPVSVLVREQRSGFQDTALQAMARRMPHLRIVPVAGDEIVRPERLLIARGEPCPNICRFALAEDWREIGSLYREAYGPAPGPHNRKVHLSRRNQRIRRLANEDALEPIFARHGYETLAPETLSHRDQAHMMMQSRAIASVSGAALTNMMFAEQSLQLTVMCPREIDEPFWEALALLLGHGFDYIEGGPAGWNDQFAVDPVRLEAALSLADARSAA